MSNTVGPQGRSGTRLQRVSTTNFNYQPAPDTRKYRAVSVPCRLHDQHHQTYPLNQAISIELWHVPQLLGCSVFISTFPSDD